MSDISGKLSENKDLSATISPKGGTLSASLMSGRGVGHGIPDGGTTGQVLTKASNDDYDATWQNPAVSSVAGKTGAVTLDGGDVAYSDSATYGDGTVGKEVSDLKSAVSDMYPTDTASGAIANFPDGAKDVPVDSLKVNIEPVQDLHGYDNPWLAGGGKNLINPDITLYRRYLRDTGQGQYFWTYSSDSLSIAIPVKSNTAYTISRYLTTQSIYRMSTIRVSTLPSEADTNDIETFQNARESSVSGFGTSHTLTTDADATFIVIQFAGNTMRDFVQNGQLELGTTATAYAPYSNICPISGWNECKVMGAGKNLLDLSSLRGGNFDYPANFPTANISTNGYVCIKGGQTYTWSQDAYPTSGGRYVIWYDENHTQVGKDNIYSANPVQVTSPSNAVYARFMWYSPSYFTSIDDVINQKPVLSVGSTATSYEPYQGETYTIELGDTIYGGVLDVGKGELTVDRAMVDLGTLTWIRNGYFFLSRNLAPRAANYWGVTQKSNVICSQYTAQKWNDIASNVVDYSCGAYENQVRVADSRYSNPEELKAALSGVTMVYELETPITIQLTPQQITTLLGTNNIFADTGDTEVTYKADVQLYIQKKISAAVAALS